MAPDRSAITVDSAPGVDLPPQLATDLRAAVQDALAGRAQPADPIELTIEAGGVVVRAGALSRRIAVEHWNYSTVRMVALHVLDLLQPAPEVPDGAPANPTPDAAAPPAAAVVVGAPARERAADGQGPWTLHANIAGARGTQGVDPWIVGGSVGAAWTREWLRIGAEVGWDHAFVRHLDNPYGLLTTVKYDATPFRLSVAIENSTVMLGVRGGVAGYRVTGSQAYWEVTPLVGPFIGFRFPIVGRVRGFLMAGFDYFARRTELSNGGFDPVYSTPQVAPYVSLVIEAGLGS
jgi:hypothetical protein